MFQEEGKREKVKTIAWAEEVSSTVYPSSEVAQSCPTLCNPWDYCSPPGSSIHRTSQARVLEWAAIFFSRDLPYPGIEPTSLALQAVALPSEPPGKPCCRPALSTSSLMRPEMDRQEDLLVQWLETPPTNMKTEECALRGQGCMLWGGFPNEHRVPGQQRDRITIVIFVFRTSLPNTSPQMLAWAFVQPFPLEVTESSWMTLK